MERGEAPSALMSSLSPFHIPMSQAHRRENSFSSVWTHDLGKPLRLHSDCTTSSFDLCTHVRKQSKEG